MKIKKYLTVGTLPKPNRKIVEGGRIVILNAHVYDPHLFMLVVQTSFLSEITHDLVFCQIC